MVDEPYRMDIQEFTEQGYLQEANRRFFHPLGLSLEVIPHADGWRLGGIRDERDDLAGTFFAPDVISADKAINITNEIAARRQPRLTALGYVIQPVQPVQPIEPEPVQEDTTT